MKILIPFLKILDYLAPSLSGRIAYWFLSNPQKKKLRNFEQATLDEAVKSKLNFKDFVLQTYLWNGNATKKALVVHGWEGQAGNFGAIVPLLIEKGFCVESFDAPSHGYSSRGNTSIMDYFEIIGQFIERNNYELIITHSFGSVATIFALSKSKANIKQIILLTTPNKFEDRIQMVIDALGLTNRTKKAFIKLFEKKTGYDPLTLNATDFCQNIHAEKVTFIHDKNDTAIPIEWSREVHESWANSEFIEIEHTGHFKMLWSKTTLSILKDII
jgi:pimeloyl-ACP methyl ester carboxylesterase